MEYALLGWPSEEPTLRLDYRRFSYAGKFVMSNTGKAVARSDGDVVAAIAFNPDRTDGETLWLRYVTVREDRRGEGVGPRLVAFVVDRAVERGFGTVKIAVNNPFAYEALYRAGFGFTGEQTGIAELVLERPGPRDRERYQSGLDVFRARDLEDAEASFLSAKVGTDPPAPLEPRADSGG